MKYVSTLLSYVELKRKAENRDESLLNSLVIANEKKKKPRFIFL